MIPLRDSQPSYSKPLVTVSLIAVNVLIFLYQLSLDSFSLNHFIASFGLIPSRVRPEALVTSMFLHGGWMHVIGNMWFLWIYGDNVEDTLGHAKYLLFYLLCGVAAGLVHMVFNADSRIPTIGASGAIAGVLAAYLVFFPRARVVTLVPLFILPWFINIPALVFIVIWFLLQFFSGVAALGAATSGGVAYWAHVGGFICGLLLVWFFAGRSRNRPQSYPDEYHPW